MSDKIEYWDSGVFIAYFNRATSEGPNGDIVEELLEEAKAGSLLIVTSFLTLTEAIGKKPVPASKQQEITLFFQHEYFEWVGFHRGIAEHARKLIWTHGLKSRDAVHLASAAEVIADGVTLDAVCAFDEDFTNLNDKLSEVSCPIRTPRSAQMLLRLNDERTAKKKKARKRSSGK